MRNYNITRYTLILTIFLMLFFVSCDDDYPTQTSNENDIFILDILSSIDGGDIDYASHNSAEQTLIKVTLLKTNSDGASEEVQSNKRQREGTTRGRGPSGGRALVEQLHRPATGSDGNGELATKSKGRRARQKQRRRLLTSSERQRRSTVTGALT